MGTLPDQIREFLRAGVVLGVAASVAAIAGNAVLRRAFAPDITAAGELLLWILTCFTYIAGMLALCRFGHLPHSLTAKYIDGGLQEHEGEDAEALPEPNRRVSGDATLSMLPV